MDTERSGLVRGGCDDLAWSSRVSIAADDDRQAGEFRSATNLDRGKELVQVDVQDPGVWRRVAHALLA
jgi:hypothetical protein